MVAALSIFQPLNEAPGSKNAPPRTWQKMGEKVNTPAATSRNATAQTQLGRRRANETLVVANSCATSGVGGQQGSLYPLGNG